VKEVRKKGTSYISSFIYNINKFYTDRKQITGCSRKTGGRSENTQEGKIQEIRITFFEFAIFSRSSLIALDIHTSKFINSRP
jgi:hypothetical protein